MEHHKFWLITVLSLFNFMEARITTLESTINGQRTMMAQEGCDVELTCAGEGTSVMWRVFGVRDPLTTNGNIRVINPINTGTSNGMVMGQLLFDSIRASDTGAYTCTIGDVTRTIRITVRGAVIVEPGNTEYDISDHSIGDTLPVLCRVEACVPISSVAVRRGTVILNKTTITNTQQDPQLNLNVTRALQGEHDCHVTYEINGQTMMGFSMPFNITGTPTEPPTTSTNNKNGATVASSFFSFIVLSLTIFIALLQ